MHATFNNNLSEELSSSTANPLSMVSLHVSKALHLVIKIISSQGQNTCSLQVFQDKDEDSLRDVRNICEGDFSLAASRLVNWDGK